MSLAILPHYRGPAARRWLVGLWGLPNACPAPAELRQRGPLAFLGTRRELFVDDEHDGAPVATWEPDDLACLCRIGRSYPRSGAAFYRGHHGGHVARRGR